MLCYTHPLLYPSPQRMRIIYRTWWTICQPALTHKPLPKLSHITASSIVQRSPLKINHRNTLAVPQHIGTWLIILSMRYPMSIKLIRTTQKPAHNTITLCQISTLPHRLHNLSIQVMITKRRRCPISHLWYSIYTQIVELAQDHDLFADRTCNLGAIGGLGHDLRRWVSSDTATPSSSQHLTRHPARPINLNNHNKQTTPLPSHRVHKRLTELGDIMSYISCRTHKILQHNTIIIDINAYWLFFFVDIAVIEVRWNWMRIPIMY